MCEKSKRMKKTISAAIFLFAAASLVAVGQFPAWGEEPAGLYTNMVGVKIVGVSQGWNILSLPLIPSCLAQGEVTGASAEAITDSAASWTPDGFAGYYVRVTKGVNIFSYFITGNTETELTVSKGDPEADGVGPGDAYAIRPGLEEILGGVDGPLTAGDGFTTPSDEVVVWNAAAQKVGGSALLRDIPDSEFQGWFDLVWNPSELDVDADMGFWLRHHGAAVELPVRGDVAVAERVVTVEPGWNILGVSLPVSEALNAAGVDETELELFGHAGDELTEPADRISIWGSATQKIVDSAFLSSVAGFEGWLDATWNPSQVIISPGQGFWYWHAPVAPAFAWSDMPPYL